MHPPEHHGHAVRDVSDDREVVGDEEVGQAQPFLQRLQQIDDARLGTHIQRRHRLVADHEVRVHGQRTRDHDALALPARELVRMTAHDGRVHADQGHQFGHALGHRARRHRLVHPQRLGQDLRHSHARVQARIRVLQHELHVPAHRAQLGRAHADQLPAHQAHRASAGGLQLQDGPSRRGLARARFAHQPQRLAAGDVEGHRVCSAHRRPRVARREGDGQVTHLQQRGWRSGSYGQGLRGIHCTAPPGVKRGTASSSARV